MLKNIVLISLTVVESVVWLLVITDMLIYNETQQIEKLKYIRTI